ncbi:MAG TPA: hypothetical protein VFZ66_04240 [Herpetosiphonaceae bacterium]
MLWKKTTAHLRQRLHLDDWCSHYEVCVTRHQVEYLIARVASPSAAERLITRTCFEVEVNRQAFRWQRVRGVHPWKMAQLCTWLLLLAMLIPLPWLSGGLSLLFLAIICGLLSSGRQWRHGGIDDR